MQLSVLLKVPGLLEAGATGHPLQVATLASARGAGLNHKSGGPVSLVFFSLRQFTLSIQVWVKDPGHRQQLRRARDVGSSMMRRQTCRQPSG